MSIHDIAASLMQAEQPEQLEPTGAEEVVEQEAAEHTEVEEVEAEEYEADGEDYDEADEDESEPEWYNVKIDGEEHQVTLEEALAGYQRDSDYRKKTMKLSEDKKAFEAEKAKLDETIGKLESYIESQNTNVDWDELRRSDPAQYLEKKEALDAAKKAAEIAKKERQTELEAQQKAYIDAESAKLVDMMGGEAWNTEQRNTDMKLATDYLSSKGVSEQEMASLVDHRLWGIIFDAAKAQKYAQTQVKVKEGIRKAPKSVKPGQKVPASQRRMDKATKALASSDKRNAVNNLANILNMLE